MENTSSNHESKEKKSVIGLALQHFYTNLERIWYFRMDCSHHCINSFLGASQLRVVVLNHWCGYMGHGMECQHSVYYTCNLH